jgi:hypothetical protein
MIHLDFSYAVAIYTIISVGIIFLVWLTGKKGKDKDLSLDERFIWFCSVCTYTYINTRDENFTLCPRCGSYNKK